MLLPRAFHLQHFACYLAWLFVAQVMRSQDLYNNSEINKPDTIILCLLLEPYVSHLHRDIFVVPPPAGS